MSYERLLVLLDGELRQKVENYIHEDARVEVADDGILLYNSKQLVIKISVSYYVKQTGAILEGEE